MHEPTLFPTFEEPRRTASMIRRRDLDQYFTAAYAAEAIVRQKLGLLPSDVGVDVGSGEGAFLTPVPREIECIGVEIDPALAAVAANMSGREVICGDFRTVQFKKRPTICFGNPPFSIMDDILECAHDLLPDNGRCGFIMPDSMFSYGEHAERWLSRWSINRSPSLPRQVFPWAPFSFCFCLFSKQRIRRYRGMFLFREAAMASDCSDRVRMVLMRGRAHKSVWRAVIEDAIAAFNGKATRAQIRAYVSGRRPRANRHWVDKVRQIINEPWFVEDDDGVSLRAA